MGTRYTMDGAVPKGQSVNPDGSQSRYTRGAANNQTSSKLKSYQQCVAKEMNDAGGSRADVRDSFEEAADKCSS